MNYEVFGLLCPEEGQSNFCQSF